MATECFCTLCERLVDIDKLVMDRDWQGGRGRKNVAIFRDKKTGVVHTVLTENNSQRYRPKEVTVEQTVINPPEHPATPAVEASEVPNAVACVEPEPTPAEEVVGGQPDVPEVEWEPQPDEWFTATVASIHQEYFFVTLSNGEQVFCFIESVTNMPGQHFCLIQDGDPVAVRIEKSKRGLTAVWRALEVVLEKTYDYDISKTEKATVYWCPDTCYGTATRDCGCRIFYRTRDDLFVEKGDRVVIGGIVKNTHDSRGGYLATKVKLEVEIEGEDS